MLAKITRGNQVTIPKAIAGKAHIREGNDYVDIEYVNGIICLKLVDIEERVPDYVYENLIKKALKTEAGDKAVSEAEAKSFLEKRAKQ